VGSEYFQTLISNSNNGVVAYVSWQRWGWERLLFAGFADVGGSHGEGAGEFALADLAAFGGGGGGDAAGDNVDELLLVADAAFAQGVDGEEGTLSLHDGGDAGFLGDGELGQESGITLEGLGGGVLGGEDARAVESQHVGGALATTEGQFQIAEHVNVHLGLAQHGAEVQVWHSFRAGGARENDDGSLHAGSPGVSLGNELDGALNKVVGSLVGEFQSANATHEFPISVHDLAINGVNVGSGVNSRASESGQTEHVVFQALFLVSLLDGANKSKKVLSCSCCTCFLRR